MPTFAPANKPRIVTSSYSCLYGTGKYQSGQMGQTVNLLAFAFGGSNPSLPTAERLIAEVAQLIEH